MGQGIVIVVLGGFLVCARRDVAALRTLALVAGHGAHLYQVTVQAGEGFTPFLILNKKDERSNLAVGKLSRSEKEFVDIELGKYLVGQCPAACLYLARINRDEAFLQLPDTGPQAAGFFATYLTFVLFFE